MFETTIEKVIVGGYDNNGNANPHMLNFIFKSGVSNKDYIGKIDQSKIVKLTEFSCDYQHYVFEKTEKGGGRKLLVPQIKVIVSLNIWRPGKKTDERMQNNRFLSYTFVIRGVPDEDFRQNQRDGRERMEKYKDIKIIDNYNVMLIFLRNRK